MPAPELAAAGDIADDAAVARSIAETAAGVLLGVRSDTEVAGLSARGDAVSQHAIAELLARARPCDKVLSEEAVDDIARLSADRVWIIDPLDGSREYGEIGRVDWAVHVALWVAGDLVAGAVALPALGVTLATDKPPALPERRPGRLRIAVSRTRPPALVDELASALDAKLVPMGSAGYKVAAVMRGEVDAYVHAGGQYEWDSAAPVAVARAVGLHASRVDGSALRYNAPDPLLPDLLVCRPECASTLLGHLAPVGSGR